jgi:8-oxo-dGTP pyrophosphatase MutT (NUDIX family)
MKILTEIFRNQGIAIHGKTDHRSAVRAVVIRDKSLLMVYSPINGDYKFPGGGVRKNEKPQYALKREIQEECGMNLLHVIQDIGSVIEYAIPMKTTFDVFKMTSSYYLCEIDSEVFKQRLEPYEQELGFQPVWVDIDTAIQTNTTILRSETKKPPQWTGREVFMLEYIKGNYLNSTQLTASPTAGTPPPAPHAPVR